MPELPEVETVVRGLKRTVVGKTIAAVTLNAPNSSLFVSPSLGKHTFDRLLAGKKIIGVTRRGKNILISLSGGLTLWVHLKMTGHFLYLDRTQPLEKHDLVVIDFEKSSQAKKGKHLRFNDYRRFGRLRLFPSEEVWTQPGLADLGPEPLELSADEFVALCFRRPRMIKPALLDQTFIAGLGNIYTDESLYLARLHPRRLTTSISRRKLVELHGYIQEILRHAIRLMGTSVDSYSGVNGRAGRYQKYLQVYHRENEPCFRCGARIVREKVGSRSAHFCPRCQRI